MGFAYELGAHWDWRHWDPSLQLLQPIGPHPCLQLIPRGAVIRAEPSDSSVVLLRLRYLPPEQVVQEGQVLYWVRVPTETQVAPALSAVPGAPTNRGVAVLAVMMEGSLTSVAHYHSCLIIQLTTSRAGHPPKPLVPHGCHLNLGLASLLQSQGPPDASTNPPYTPWSPL